MWDIYFACVFIMALSITLFWLGFRLCKSLTDRKYYVFSFGTVGVLLGYIFMVKNSPYLVYFIPFSNAIILGNWIPLIAGFLAGIGMAKIPGGILRKLVYIVPLMLACYYNAYAFLLESPPQSENRWKEGVCLQTSDASCGAACAATILRFYDIPATESEMISLCLTKETGTFLLGLYRGLKLKTNRTNINVQIFRKTITELRKTKMPVILRVGLESTEGVDPRYYEDWGWIPGVMHMVVLFGFTNDGRIQIGDPAVGKEHWHVESLDVLWNGDGVTIAPLE